MAIIAPTVNKEELKERIIAAVRDMYTDVATYPAQEFHFPTGRIACEYVGYQVSDLDGIPEEALESFAGVGFPFKANIINLDDTVLDIGSGSGTDIFIAAHKVGECGLVYGLDITDAMIEKVKKNIVHSGLKNIRIVEGDAESIPLPDKMFDIVTSNGVLNLVPDKQAAFSEIYRVLKPGGKIQISDITLVHDLSEKSRSNPQLWAECIVGAVQEEKYIDLIHSSGFKAVRVIDRNDYFDRSENEATKKVAKQYGAISITITAVKE